GGVARRIAGVCCTRAGGSRGACVRSAAARAASTRASTSCAARSTTGICTAARSPATSCTPSTAGTTTTAAAGADLPIGDDEIDLILFQILSQILGELVQVVGVEIDLGVHVGRDVPLDAVEREIGRPAAEGTGIGRRRADVLFEQLVL